MIRASDRHHPQSLPLMNATVFLAGSLILAAAAPAAPVTPAAAAPRTAAPATPAAPAPPPDPAREDRLQWFHEAKYGLFINWGLYSIPAGEWKGKPIAGIGEWIMNRAKIPVKEYEQLAARFNPGKFDADA